MNGLRTLVISRKILTPDFYKKWSEKYETAYNKLEIDHKVISKLMN